MFRRKKRPVTNHRVEATASRILAEQDLERRLADAHRIRALVAEWRRIRERNHIREGFEASLRGGHR